ncbi:MAG: class I SAM-dependent methyltransferase [Cyclobacteriaceae bacterium]|nr:class I SAM-dependent methyltransferase [Cyclobacteriaceae bacterium]
MLKELLQPEVKTFINELEKKPVDYDRLLFNKANYPNIPIALVVDQLKAKQKAKNKLPLWFSTKGVVMPPLLSMEQCSSELAATYKSNLYNGKLAIDLTGGAGVDAYYLSTQFEQVIYVEMNEALAEVAMHNFKLLGADNIKVVTTKSEQFIAEFEGEADLIYIDPARRNQNQKLFLLEDCSPNMLELQANLLKKAKKLLVKASPMLDITLAIKQLNFVQKVHIVAIKNEVKELLFELNVQEPKTINVIAIDLAILTRFETSWNTSTSVKYSNVLSYLYEPNAAILKSGKMDDLVNQHAIFKLNPHTHLFTSNALISNFPGRKFKVGNVLKYDKKEVKRCFNAKQANISARNFPDSVSHIQKKLDLKPGGVAYLFAIRDYKSKAKIVVCSKI